MPTEINCVVANVMARSGVGLSSPSITWCADGAEVCRHWPLGRRSSHPQALGSPAGRRVLPPGVCMPQTRHGICSRSCCMFDSDETSFLSFIVVMLNHHLIQDSVCDHINPKKEMILMTMSTMMLQGDKEKECCLTVSPLMDRTLQGTLHCQEHTVPTALRQHTRTIHLHRCT